MARKRRKHAVAPGAGLIQVMTVSLFIILLAFFILLNSIAVIDEKRKRLAIGSLLESFGVLAGGFSFIEGSGGDPIVSQFPTVASQIDFDEDLLRAARLTSDERSSAVSIPARLLFEGDGTSIKTASYPLLDSLCRTIKQNDYPIEIIGHTDNLPTDAKVKSSKREISAIRALRLLEYFVNEGGMRADRLTGFGWGEHRPVADNSTKETRELNRRMDIVFVHEAARVKPKGVYTFKDFFFRVFD